MAMDQKLVSYKQLYELRHVCRKFHVSIDILRTVLTEMTGTDKPARSRKDIEAELEARGYSDNNVIVTYDQQENEYVADNGKRVSSGPTEQDAINGLNEE